MKKFAITLGALVTVLGIGTGTANAAATIVPLGADDGYVYTRSYADGVPSTSRDMMEWAFDRDNDGTASRVTYINEKGELRVITNGNTVAVRLRTGSSAQTAAFLDIQDANAVKLAQINRYALWESRTYSSLASMPTTGLAAGAMSYRTDLNKPVWWDGAAWCDAMHNCGS